MGELLGSITHQEWVEWQVFASREPIGPQRADVQAAQVAYMVAATAPRKKGAPKPKFASFVPDYWKPETTPNAMLAFAAGLTRQMGGPISPRVQEALTNGQRGEADGDAGP